MTEGQSLYLDDDRDTAIFRADFDQIHIPILNVATSKNKLATIFFEKNFMGSGKSFYIDDIIMRYDSYLELNISSTNTFISTKNSLKPFLHRIGFYLRDYNGQRHGLKESRLKDGSFMYSIDKFKDWSPPMVPEPASYGVGVMGVGLAAIGLHRRVAKRARLCNRTV